MQTAVQPNIVADAKAEFDRAIDRMKLALNSTPDDKLGWAPGPDARTPLMQVAHVANSITGITGWLKGEKMDWSDLKAIDARWRTEERTVTTREQAKEMLERSAAGYHVYLDSLTPEQLAADFELPMGTRRMSDVITFAADHVRNHCAQLEYTQTCYGDLDWHMA